MKTNIIFVLIFLYVTVAKFPTGSFFDDKACSGPSGIRQYRENHCAQRIKGANVFEKGQCLDGNSVTITRCTDASCTVGCTSTKLPTTCLAFQGSSFNLLFNYRFSRFCNF